MDTHVAKFKRAGGLTLHLWVNAEKLGKNRGGNNKLLGQRTKARAAAQY